MDKHDLYDVACIGNYTKDTIVTPAGTSYVDGGAVNYSAHAARCLGLKVAVVTRLSRQDVRVVDKFGQAGIDCFPTYTPDSTCMRLEYPTTDPDIRTLSVTSTAGTITPAEVQALDMRAAIIGSSFRGEVGLDVIQHLRARGLLLALDVQGFVRVLRGDTLVYEAWPGMREALAYVEILKSDAVEAQHLTGESDIHRAAQAFADLGPREIVLTHKDGLLIYADQRFLPLKFHARQLSGRSGRGDTCLGSYVSRRLSGSPEDAGIWAAALTSLKMERPGPFSLSSQHVEALIHAEYDGRVASTGAN
jgi:sugar/nucleoside kinase (ribokinase family)